MYKGEKVLVVPADKCQLEKFGGKQFLNYGDGDNLNYLINLLGNSLFMDREEAETNPNFKQIIPYCVLYRLGKIYNGYFTYQRTKKSGETRLVGKSSCGVGGHCDGKDYIEGENKFAFYQQSIIRELKEETTFGGYLSDNIIGFIYDNSNLVGQVHLGVVHKVLVHNDLKAKEDHLCNDKFQSLEAIRADRENYETWSQIILDSGLLI